METSYCHVDRPVGTGVGIDRRSEDRMFSFIPDRVPAWGSLYPSIVMEELGRANFSPYNSWTRGGKTCEWVSSPVLTKLAKIGPLEEKSKRNVKALKCFFSPLLRVICIHRGRFHKLLMGASKANWFMPVSVCRICYILLRVMIACVCVCACVCACACDCVCVCVCVSVCVCVICDHCWKSKYRCPTST